VITEDASEDLQRFETPDEAFQYLRYVGVQPDADIDLAEAALALALVFLPGVHVDRFRQHFKKLAHQAETEFEARLRHKEPDSLSLRIQVLRKVIHELNGYRGDEKTYDDIQNLSLIRVIERRLGLPVTLGLIYIVVGRARGWEVDGLNFPGHFVVRAQKEGERIILDPFREGREMNAAELRQLLKSIVGKGAELSHNYYNPVTNRDILIRLQNNLKKRLIEQEEYAQAVQVIETMEALAPDEYRTLFDKGVLYAKLGQKGQATAALERYIEKTPHAADRQQARILLQQINAAP
jgi:regulator of sirC expression with transglutaminase-like and TPR domain